MLERWPRRGLVSCALLAFLCASACARSGRVSDWAVVSEPLAEGAYLGYLRGRLAMIRGDYDTAVREFSVASRAAPDQVYIAIALIEAVDQAGERDRALSMAERARARWPRTLELWILSGDLYRVRSRERNDREDRGRALVMFRRALELHPAPDARADIQARIRALAADK